MPSPAHWHHLATVPTEMLQIPKCCTTQLYSTYSKICCIHKPHTHTHSPSHGCLACIMLTHHNKLAVYPNTHSKTSHYIGFPYNSSPLSVSSTFSISYSSRQGRKTAFKKNYFLQLIHIYLNIYSSMKCECDIMSL